MVKDYLPTDDKGTSNTANKVSITIKYCVLLIDIAWYMYFCSGKHSFFFFHAIGHSTLRLRLEYFNDKYYPDLSNLV